MLKVKTQVLRKDNLFLDPETKEILETFPSISKAKKESRIRQASNGGLGRGYLQTVDTRDKKLKAHQFESRFISPKVRTPVVKTLPKLSVGDVNRLVALLKTSPVPVKRTISTRLKRPTRGDY